MHEQESAAWFQLISRQGLFIIDDRSGKNVALPLLSKGIVCLLESHTSALTCVHTLLYQRGVRATRREKNYRSEIFI